MTNDKEDSRIRNFFISFLKIFVGLIILSSFGVITFFVAKACTNPTNLISYNNIEQLWIPSEIKKRQIFIKFEYSYIQNKIEINRTNYFNGFIYFKNQVIIPPAILNCGEVINNNPNNLVEFTKCNLYYSSLMECENKNINDKSIWHRFNIIKIPKFINSINTNDIVFIKNKDYFLNVDLPYQFIVCETNIDSNLDLTKFKINNVLRKDPSYNYWYSSIYYEQDIIKYKLGQKETSLWVSKKNSNVKSNYYSIKVFDKNNNSFNLIYSFVYNTTFEFDSSYRLKNNGSVNSFVIDPIGNLFCEQLNVSLNPNKAMFVYNGENNE